MEIFHALFFKIITNYNDLNQSQDPFLMWLIEWYIKMRNEHLKFKCYDFIACDHQVWNILYFLCSSNLEKDNNNNNNNE